MGKVEDKLLDHSYDGINEFDNPLPPWWVGLFIFTIIWSIIYVFYFHIASLGPNQLEELNQEYELAQKNMPATPKDELDLASLTTALTEADVIESGKKVYVNNCASCHGMSGEGGIGPAFADKYWIHGGSFADIIKTIVNGVPEKGMISWKGILKNKDIANVASYLEVFQGTSPANLKAPQGDLYDGGTTAASGDSTATQAAATDTTKSKQ